MKTKNEKESVEPDLDFWDAEWFRLMVKITSSKEDGIVLTQRETSLLWSKLKTAVDVAPVVETLMNAMHDMVTKTLADWKEFKEEKPP